MRSSFFTNCHPIPLKHHSKYELGGAQARDTVFDIQRGVSSVAPLSSVV